jgi:hypothetical protein
MFSLLVREVVIDDNCAFFVDTYAGLGGQFGIGLISHADDDQIGIHGLVVGELDAGCFAIRAEDFGDLTL